MRLVTVTWGKLKVELPAELLLYLLFKAFLIYITYLSDSLKPPRMVPPIRGSFIALIISDSLKFDHNNL
jgi:hypothetical protein